MTANAIALEDIRFMASQRLTDNDDGGGYMSATEIVDGQVNNMFTNTSRLDRVYGKVSIKKGFVNVNTDGTETYSGAHVIVSAPAVDPNISVCIFETGSDSDVRTNARDRIESYVTLGPPMNAWLWGDQPKGSRTLRMFTGEGAELPEIGSVLCLFNDKGLPTEQKQYVRVTDVDTSLDDFTVVVNNRDKDFKRLTLTVGVGDPLEHTFLGAEIDYDDSIKTTVFSTVASDASKYYGVMLPKENYSKDDITLTVQSIFTHLVPSAQAESPMADLTPGEAGPVFESGQGFSFTIPSFVFKGGASLAVGRAIVPGSLTISRNTTPALLEDNGKGILMGGSTQYGTINYELGTVIFSAIDQHTASAVVSCKIGVSVPMLPNSAKRPVDLASRGFNWTVILEPPPKPGSLKVDYMAQGKWFRLTDKGGGELIANTDGAGTGTVNYLTGSVILTCGALPDVDSSILYNWGNPLECVDLSSSVTIDRPEMKHTVSTFPVNPGSISIDWQTGVNAGDNSPVMAKITDDGNGNLIGDGEGSIRYSTGELKWVPALLPIEGESYKVDYESYPIKQGDVGSSGSGSVIVQLPEGDIEPGSVVLNVEVSIGSKPYIYKMFDDGAGGLSADGTSIGYSLTNPTWPGHTIISGITGTIDYVLGKAVIDLTTISGTEKWTEPFRKWWSTTGSVSGLRWVTFYHDEVTTPISWTNSSASSVGYSYRLTASSIDAAEETVHAPDYVLDLTVGAGYTIQPGSVCFEWQGANYMDYNGKLQRNPDPTTGIGAEAGTINYETGECRVSVYGNGSPTVNIKSLVGRIGKQRSSSLCFRCPGAPIRPTSLNLVGTLANGSPINLSSDFDGNLSGAGGHGKIDYETGVVDIFFGEFIADNAEFVGQPWYDPANVKDGQVFKPTDGLAESIKYGCTVYSYMPLDAGLIGLNPVRLPSDGRVPIVRRGDVIVVHNTVTQQLNSGIGVGTTVTLDKEPDSLEIYDSSEMPVRVVSTMYERAGLDVTFGETYTPASYTEPLVAMVKIEDMVLVTDVDITGRITVSPALSHDYPKENTFVSSALKFGDLQSRFYNMFDQETWQDEWSDSLSGDSCIANYNQIGFAPEITNGGAVSEQWALIFDSTDHFKIVGKNYGVIGEGFINQDCQPINSATGKPFFFLDHRGFGSGWAAGNVIRFNTRGASPPFWVARTTLQGPPTEPNDQYVLQLRGDAE